MLGHMKKHHTRETPYMYSNRAEDEKTYSWEEVFAEGIAKFSKGGLILRGYRYKNGITQKKLAEAIHIKAHHISEMENGKRPIGKNMAHKLAKVFDVDYRMFL